MRFPNRREIGIFVAVGLAGCFAVARSAEDAVFSTDVAVVNVLASVRDKQGGLVADLDKEDFVLAENGEEQKILYFVRQADLPLTIGLLVDTSLSQRNLLPAERAAGRRFFEQVLRPNKDLAFVLGFDFDAVLHQDLTGSLAELEEALDGLETPPPPIYPRRFVGSGFQFPFPVPGGGGRGGGRGQGDPDGGWGGRRPSRGGGRGIGTVMYDSVYLAASEVLADRAGRKAVVLISDGVDLGSKVDIEGAVEAALRAETAVYSIRYYDRAAYQSASRGTIVLGGPNGKGPLCKLSEKTGGAMFEVSEKLSLDEIFARIEEELRSQYSLGYTPAETAKPGEFRTIRLRTKNKKLKVFTRSGYYASP